MTESAGQAALSRLRVLDLSSGVAGQYCGKLLAAYGADCILAEPPAGSPTRHLFPVAAGGSASLRSSAFRHLNQGKSAVVVTEANDQLRELASLADVIIRDETSPLPGAITATTVECVISEFPATGPYAGWQGNEMIHQALAGAMYMTGWPDRQPLYGTGYRGYYACGTTAFVSILAALHERRRSGLGQTVSASVFGANAAIAQNLVSQYSYNRSYESRRQYPGFLALLRCRDHWMVLFAIRHWEQLCAAFGLEHLLTDPRLATQASRLKHWDVVVDQMRAQAAEMRAADLVAALQRGRISAEVIVPLSGLITSPQWQARRLLRQASRPDGRTESALAAPFAVGDTPYCGVQSSPPLRRGGAASRQVRVITQRWRRARPAEDASQVPTAATPGGSSLTGLRVLDLTTAWAGPLAARGLAHLGAEVIKIDAPSHMDSWRGAIEDGAARFYPNGQPGRQPWNRSVLFNTQGQGKLSFGLDLKQPGARDVMLRLAAKSDILISNFTPGVLDRLGIGYPDLSAVNRGIIVVEMPAFGPGGPDSSHQGMGKTMEAASGMATLMGYGDGSPVLTGPAYLDPIGGLTAVAATLTALHRRDITGRGCRVEVPQTEAGLHWIGEQVLQQADAGDSWRPDGNTVGYAAPHDAYPCRGTDEWIAIAVVTTQHWQALCREMGRGDLAGSARYATLAGRQRARRNLGETISAWTRQFGKHDLATRLQRVGVPAAPVNNGSDVAADLELLRSGFIRKLTHPAAGTHAYPSLAYDLARTPGGITHPAPLFGQHNDYVLREVLGLPEAEVEELNATGAVTGGPVVPGTAAAQQTAAPPAPRLNPHGLSGHKPASASRGAP